MPRYHGLAPMYYRAARAALVVYDVANKDSYTEMQSWVTKLRSTGPDNLVIGIAGERASHCGRAG